MKFILNKDKLIIEDKESFNSGSLKYYEILVEKDTTWDGLSIGAIIIKEGADKGIAIPVINNRVYVDRETNGKYFVGFKGYTVEYNLTEDTTVDTSKTYYTRSGEEGSYIYTKVDNPVVEYIGTYYEEAKTYQQSTNLVAISFLKGAGEIEIRNEEVPTQSEWEAYVEQIQDMVDGLEDEIPTIRGLIAEKQDELISGTNIKTINNESILGRGNIVIQGGGGGTGDYEDLENKPSINNVTLSENKSLNDLGIINFSGNYNDLSNKPTIPTVPTNISAFTNDVGYLTQHQDISGKQNITDNTLTTTNKTVPTAINEVNSIAKGANQALSYSNYQSMVTAFNSLDDDVYNIGQNVMIVTLEVPDLWISGIESTSSTYIYTTDSAIVNALQTTGYIQVGYYKLSQLETQKVDLTNYELLSNKVASTTGISSSSTDTQYPSAKCVYDYIQGLDASEVSY